MAGKIVLTCPTCSNPFERFPSRIGRAKYCSKACRNRGREKPVEEIFWSHVDIRNDEECWNWMASLDDHGYGQFGSKRLGGHFSSHRLSYILTNGPIPDGLFVCHRCDNPKCINPKHLFLGTPLDNVKDMISKGRGRYIITRGEDSHFAKISASDVIAIRQDPRPTAEIAQDFNISLNQVRRIKSRENWSHIE